jgi:lipoate-protein ligase A
VGRESLSGRGVRSAEKAVSPLSWFTSLSCDEVEGNLLAYFMGEFGARESSLARDELERARRLVETKYATPAWINRLP